MFYIPIISIISLIINIEEEEKEYMGTSIYLCQVRIDVVVGLTSPHLHAWHGEESRRRG